MGRVRRPRLSLPLTVTVLCWGFNFVAVKTAYREFEVPALALARLLITWALLAAVCRVRGESLRFPKGDALRLVAMGFLANGVYMVVFLLGMDRTGAGEAAIILNTSPVFVLLMSAAAGHERFRWGTLFGAVVALTGVAAVATVGSGGLGGGQWVGNALILLSSVLWAWSVVVARPLLDRYSPIRVFTLSMAGAALVMVPFGIGSFMHTDWRAISPLGYAMLGHMAVLAGAVAFTGFYAGVAQVGATGAMLYQYSVPPLAALFAWLCLGSTLHWMQIIGMVIVVIGVSLAWRSRAEPAREEPVPAEG